MNQDQLIREIQERYRVLDRSLNERQRRLWAATEALNRGRGGISLVSRALRISPNTIKKGMQEIRSGQAESAALSQSRIRKPGGGRKPQRALPDRTSDAELLSEDASVPVYRPERGAKTISDSNAHFPGEQPPDAPDRPSNADDATSSD